MTTLLIFLKKSGSYAEGRTHHGMVHYAKKSKNASAPKTQQANMTHAYQSPSPTWAAQCESGLLQFHFDEDAYQSPPSL
jgi:hypothetical protein